MKKLVFLFGVAMSIVACSGNSTDNSASDSDTIIADTTVVDTIA